MKTIIAGSRTLRDLQAVYRAVAESGFEVSVVVSGKQKSSEWDPVLRKWIYFGADYLGEVWAEAQGIPVIPYPANWGKFGKSAGMIRNSQMADNAEALIALWDGKSKGTKNMIDTARKKGLKVYVYSI